MAKKTAVAKKASTAKVASKAPAAKKATASKAVKSAATKKPVISQDELMKRIQDRAYYIWMEKGRPEGADYDNWKQAEAEIKAAYNVQ
jgi:hypothetical protein